VHRLLAAANRPTNLLRQQRRHTPTTDSSSFAILNLTCLDARTSPDRTVRRRQSGASARNESNTSRFGWHIAMR
jgi:hypothetical protein